MAVRTRLRFSKLHGLGNDFVLIDLRQAAPAVARSATSKKMLALLADRKRGVGFDQLILVRPSRNKDARIDFLNADGSHAEMCGNGLRAAALYLWRKQAEKKGMPVTAGARLDLETCAGPRAARALHSIDSRATTARIECEMGVPRVLVVPRALRRGVVLGRKAIVPVCINVGNPHAVSFVYPLRDADLTAWGSALENHRAFPRRTNAEFIRVRGPARIDAKVWERGVGVTEACGTGAVASAVAAVVSGRVRSPVTVRFPGGQAVVRWDGQGKSAFLVAEAHFVFDGELPATAARP